MGSKEIGPKELQQRLLRDQKNAKGNRKPSTSDLRGKIAKIKALPKRSGGRGR